MCNLTYIVPYYRVFAYTRLGAGKKRLTRSPVALLRMVAPGAGFRGDTRSGIWWCHPFSCNASEAITELGENFVQVLMETKKKSSPHISEVFGRKFGENVKILILRFHTIKWYHSKMVTPGAGRPPLATQPEIA